MLYFCPTKQRIKTPMCLGLLWQRSQQESRKVSLTLSLPGLGSHAGSQILQTAKLWLSEMATRQTDATFVPQSWSPLSVGAQCAGCRVPLSRELSLAAKELHPLGCFGTLPFFYAGQSSLKWTFTEWTAFFVSRSILSDIEWSEILNHKPFL